MSQPQNPVAITDRALEAIEREARRLQEVETGGILIGFRLKDETIITHATGPGPGATHGTIFFAKDTAYLQQVLDLLFGYFGANYLGAWHKHPPELTVPSTGDLRSVQEELADPAIGLEILVFPICTVRDGQVAVSPYVVSRNGYARLAWQPLPQETVIKRGLLRGQWYESPAGKERLALELTRLREAGARVEVRKAADNSYNLYCSIGSGAEQMLVLGCPQDYPVSPPRAAVLDTQTQKFTPLSIVGVVDWTIHSHLAEIYDDQAPRLRFQRGLAG